MFDLCARVKAVSDFIVSIEDALASIAEKYTPEGTQPKAVMYQ